MTQVRFTQSSAPLGRGIVEYSGGTFDAGSALAIGGGSFVVDDVTQAALVRALDAFPGVRRAGGAGSPGGSPAVVPTAFLSGHGPPPAGTGNDGDTWMDLDTGEVYKRVSGTWADQNVSLRGKTELGYTEITSNSALTGTARGDGTVLLMLQNVVVTTQPFVLIFGCDALQQSADLGVFVLWFMRSVAGANVWTDIGLLQFTASGANGRIPGTKRIRQALAAGSYDYKVQLQAGAAGQTASIIAGVGGNGLNGPAFLQAEML